MKRHLVAFIQCRYLQIAWDIWCKGDDCRAVTAKRESTCHLLPTEHGKGKKKPDRALPLAPQAAGHPWPSLAAPPPTPLGQAPTSRCRPHLHPRCRAAPPLRAAGRASTPRHRLPWPRCRRSSPPRELAAAGAHLRGPHRRRRCRRPRSGWGPRQRRAGSHYWVEK